MTNTTSHVLFISGAGLPAWVWDATRRALPSTTSSTVAPRPAAVGAGVADYAAAALQSAGADRFVLVAHSAGGMVAAELLRRAPDRVAGLLALSAVVPQTGRSAVSSLPFPQRLVFGAALRLAGTRPPESAIRRGLASGLDTSVADRVVSDFTPESTAYFTDTSSEHQRPAHRGYVTLTADREYGPALQGRFRQTLDPTWQTTLATGHLAMLEDPVGLAAEIDRFMSAVNAG
ncbi:alpha/beta hydrolase [Nocardioides sp.]|uniref:alpha/beta fold hydrolase n=1 Tax=Nocardioides sp. TaxID=35761 RepID=UPI002B7CC33C|nr:alpha/beta hydrolase [Nocardioides sp.]HXH80939.1 alpha/beta hydrolase [Nocardioides sp.]